MKNILWWILACLEDLFIQVGVYTLLIPLSFFLSLKSRRSQKTPICLIHGYGNRSLSWFFYVWRMRKHYGPIYTMNLGSFFHSIQEYAEKVEKILSQEKQWILMGHSMGGLIACYLGAYSSYQDRILKIIAIASPFKGAHLAKWGPGACARQMIPGSSFLLDLEEKILKEEKIPIYALSSGQDRVILSYSPPFLPSHRVKQLQGVGHLGFLFSLRALKQIFLWLEEPLEKNILGKNGAFPEKERKQEDL